ncbi:MAG: acyl-ACP--UDP-N-acetylglucosamine O-acyltransferase [Planctomycetia bacterium]|nr:acyl-ACP--UDP-N-acetylglucosamine O-acyltransferase [Planctomycetia bacterium]
MQIHPQALVSPRAKIGRDVQIGPFCVIEDDVEIGNGCRLEARVSIKNGTILGENNHIFDGTIIGSIPQCIGISDICGQVIIGSGNIIRENVTIHRAMKESDATEIGDNCMFMVNAHIAHDCRIADSVIMANNTMLAGHVSVGRRAFISGAAGVHQFCRIGAFAMVGGQAHIVKDVPPFVTVDGLSSQVVGLNLIGLRRANFSSNDIKMMKSVYRILYKSGLPHREIVKTIADNYHEGPGLEMAQFLSMTGRGIITERHSVVHAGAERLYTDEPSTFKLHVISEEEDEENKLMHPLRKNVG